ncbi:glycosyltransferase family 4 protein [Nocardioides caldifontis]|uniref:glycosyltransferase family 4 protein n=1 Tax=Nocardioides caldifontis TaxID=2588938 RepID=UPI0011E02E44|nr:glycosyltransferase family 4 protein [Nocardioides caldifontis]
MSRVLLVGKGAPDRGGIPTFLEELRTGEVGRRHEVTFLNVAHTGAPQGGQVTIGNLTRTLRDVLAVWRMARDHDVVHVNSAVAPAVTVARAGLLALAARLRGAAVVMHVHGGNISTWLGSRRNELLLKAAMAPVHRVVAVWTVGYVALVGALGSDRVRLVENGVDLHRFTPSTGHHRPPRLLYVGLLTPRKGVLDLLSASSTLRDEGLEHELWLLGGTPDEGPAAAEPVLAAARDNARLLGTRPPEEMPAVYTGADVFCLPSWWEAMPMSVLEAMASGLPVVASDVGDVARLVEDGHTGFVVAPQAPEQLAVALRKVLSDADRARAMGAAGRRRVEERYSAARVADAICEVYAEAVGAR